MACKIERGLKIMKALVSCDACDYSEPVFSDSWFAAQGRAEELIERHDHDCRHRAPMTKLAKALGRLEPRKGPSMWSNHAPAGVIACRVCGCWDDDACVMLDLQACAWMPGVTPDKRNYGLCTGCANGQAAYDAQRADSVDALGEEAVEDHEFEQAIAVQTRRKE